MHIIYGRLAIFDQRRSAVCKSVLHRPLTVCNKRPTSPLPFSVDDNHVTHKIVPQMINHINRLLSFFTGEAIIIDGFKSIT